MSGLLLIICKEKSRKVSKIPQDFWICVNGKNWFRLRSFKHRRSVSKILRQTFDFQLEVLPRECFPHF